MVNHWPVEPTKWHGTWTFDEDHQKMTITPEPGKVQHYQIEGVISDHPYVWTINSLNRQVLNVTQEKRFDATTYQKVDRTFQRE